MGGCVGLSIGFVFGTVTVLTSGPGPKGYMKTVGQYMLQSGASFAFFLAIGSVIRGDEMRRARIDMNRDGVVYDVVEEYKKRYLK